MGLLKNLILSRIDRRERLPAYLDLMKKVLIKSRA